MNDFRALVCEAESIDIILIPPTVVEIDIETCDVHAGFTNAVKKPQEKIVIACTQSNIVVDKASGAVCLGVSYLAVVEIFDDGITVDYRFRYQVVTACSLCIDFIAVPAAAPTLGNGKVEGLAAEVYIHEVGMLFFACKLRRAAGDSGSRGVACRSGRFV